MSAKKEKLKQEDLKSVSGGALDIFDESPKDTSGPDKADGDKPSQKQDGSVWIG